jgi:hypothetical protein
MSWRASLIAAFNPGLLGGIALGEWIELLKGNRFRLTPKRLTRALGITVRAAQNSLMLRREERRLGATLKNVAVLPPLFILGHWRSGTTHVHNLIARDCRFAFPNTYQVACPHTFLTTETAESALLSPFWPKHRPMDNIEWSLQSPQEDDFALAVSTLMSPYVGLLFPFPQHREYYDRYLTFKEIPQSELARWRAAFVHFLKKLTWKYERPLVLKSPAHTCRIKLLLEIFPQARFVHIHRHPLTVFQSSRRMFEIAIKAIHSPPDPNELDDWILRQYRVMYDTFFAERHLIPSGQFYEMGFEQLETDPIGQLREMYEALRLPDFAVAEPALTRYVASLAGYQKNRFSELSASMQNRVADAWGPCFAEWGYDREASGAPAAVCNAAVKSPAFADRGQ